MPTANAKNNNPSRHSRACPDYLGKKQAIVSEKPRGHAKIAFAAQALGVDFHGKSILDIGSSTGGFTEYALERGATKVIAVEKGTDQMRAPLRFDPRIELHEKTDIFDFRLTSPPDLILADVSFLSLTKVLKYASMYLAGRNTHFLTMFKPQFEANPSDLHKGVVKNEKIRRGIIKNFESWLHTNNFIILGKRDNTLPGRHGNLERFYHLQKPSK